MLKRALTTATIACCLAFSSAAFAAEPLIAVSMKKPPAKSCLLPRTKICAYDGFFTCCYQDQLCTNMLDRPRCIPEL